MDQTIQINLDENPIYTKYFHNLHQKSLDNAVKNIELAGFESIPRTRFARIFSRFQRVSISSFRPAVKPKPFDR